MKPRVVIDGVSTFSKSMGVKISIVYMGTSFINIVVESLYICGASFSIYYKDEESMSL